ncbi:SDR family oxidoreductase [[Pseudopropionibacterium] massiliense]|uniref:SDR family oxidoreductase n=1 Tax=[Pseudopropionibacterium] massiliense TaxID=2220000 RepID=UPI001A9161E5|nr:SDR family NAD(P)-dependent oxidoreductase [[Pseudopropionibacterium] massiliense]
MTRMPTYDLRGRTAVVTGATGTHGSAIVRTLVESGVRTALIARNRRRIERLRAHLPDDVPTLACPADITSAYEIVEARDRILEELGAPDLVVVAAGVRRAAPFEEAIPADWTAMLATNLRGMLQTVQIFAPDVLAAGERGERADIVLLGSAPARERQHAYSVFSSIGASIGQFSRHLRAEYGPRGCASTTWPPSTPPGVSSPTATSALTAPRATTTTCSRWIRIPSRRSTRSG